MPQQCQLLVAETTCLVIYFILSSPARIDRTNKYAKQFPVLKANKQTNKNPSHRTGKCIPSCGCFSPRYVLVFYLVLFLLLFPLKRNETTGGRVRRCAGRRGGVHRGGQGRHCQGPCRGTTKDCQRIVGRYPPGKFKFHTRRLPLLGFEFHSGSSSSSSCVSFCVCVMCVMCVCVCVDEGVGVSVCSDR